RGVSRCVHRLGAAADKAGGLHGKLLPADPGLDPARGIPVPALPVAEIREALVRGHSASRRSASRRSARRPSPAGLPFADRDLEQGGHFGTELGGVRHIGCVPALLVPTYDADHRAKPGNGVHAGDQWATAGAVAVATAVELELACAKPKRTVLAAYWENRVVWISDDPDELAWRLTGPDVFAAGDVLHVGPPRPGYDQEREVIVGI